MASFFQVTTDVCAQQTDAIYDTATGAAACRASRSPSWAALQFDKPLRGDFMRVMDTIVVSEQLRDALAHSDLTGVRIGTTPCEVSVDPLAQNPRAIAASLPPLYCAIITGRALVDDFGLRPGVIAAPLLSTAAVEYLHDNTPASPLYLSIVDCHGLPIPHPYRPGINGTGPSR